MSLRKLVLRILKNKDKAWALRKLKLEEEYREALQKKKQKNG